MPNFTTTKLRLKDIYLHRTENIGKYGFGICANIRMFFMDDNGDISPVRNPDKTQLSELVYYERARNIVTNNTKALLSGNPAANI